ncbi:MAG: PhzF family phenazine biosynthesis protein [Phenylobacterium sp.]|uniref:PhzF family phenazine biosynthesis protein n=1 Tax=Phenylobacterium sp. TaxID=1871053 RepID=UPI00391D4935
MRQWTIDAFAMRPFEGNSACVVEPLDAWPSADWMQALARENNAGATAFLMQGEASHRFALRWFTPAVEVPLCGHATLAAAHALFAHARLDAADLEFQTASGLLKVRRDGGGYAMAFPSQPSRSIPAPQGLGEALGVEPQEVWAGAYLVALLGSAGEVRAVEPKLDQLRTISLELGGQGNVGIAAVAPPTADFDVIDRFFAPGYGIPEDAATGSFHCILTPIFARKLGRQRLRFHQASPGRGAHLEGRLIDGGVMISGCACTILESVLQTHP